MKLIDLTHSIRPDMPVYPGTRPPEFVQANTIVRDGFAEMRVSMALHTGTHLDAPAHIFEGAASLDQLPLESFCGKGTVISIPARRSAAITPGDIEPHRARLSTADFLLLRTDWSDRWGRDRYFCDYPVLTPQAAQTLLTLHLKGVGVDAISVDAADALALPVHRILLAGGALILENLTNLRLLPETFTLCCFPLLIHKADGSPVRAVGMV